ncbi:MAG: YwmB family TATA-box binding protein [Clostridiales bacterium]|nr:YwmB family TATA-box binding protein [Clostridiales bacterium]
MRDERFTLSHRNGIEEKKFHIPYKEVLANRKMRFLLAIVVLLWIAVGAQFVANRLFNKEGNILSAFVTTNSGLMESTLEVTAEYGNQYLTVEDKKSLISYIAAGLGVKTDSEIQTYENESRQEVVFIKQAARAQTTIKVVTLEDTKSTDAFKQSLEKKAGVTQYLMVRIVIYEDANNDILKFKDTIEEVYTNLKIAESQISETLQLCGAFAGNLLLDTKNKLADKMIDSLDGKVIYENREEEFYTVYAYTGLLREYITVNDAKINVQVAMTYDEANDFTKIYLATPIISGDW